MCKYCRYVFAEFFRYNTWASSLYGHTDISQPFIWCNHRGVKTHWDKTCLFPCSVAVQRVAHRLRYLQDGGWTLFLKTLPNDTQMMQWLKHRRSNGLESMSVDMRLVALRDNHRLLFIISNYVFFYVLVEIFEIYQYRCSLSRNEYNFSTYGTLGLPQAKCVDEWSHDLQPSFMFEGSVFLHTGQNRFKQKTGFKPKWKELL